MSTLSLDAAVAMTGVSRSTLWRRAGDGSIAKGEKDTRGRATLALDDVLALMEETGGVALAADDVAVLLRADAGDDQAQADLGALLYVAGAGKAALYWLQEAADQGNAEAMQWLGTICAAGAGNSERHGTHDEYLAVMWIARAASLGHPIAQQQMAGLMLGRRVRDSRFGGV